MIGQPKMIVRDDCLDSGLRRNDVLMIGYARKKYIPMRLQRKKSTEPKLFGQVETYVC